MHEVYLCVPVCMWLTVCDCVYESKCCECHGVCVEVREQLCGVISAHILWLPGIDLELLSLHGNVVYQWNHLSHPDFFFIYKFFLFALKTLRQAFTS